MAFTLSYPTLLNLHLGLAMDHSELLEGNVIFVAKVIQQGTLQPNPSIWHTKVAISFPFFLLFRNMMV
jgi:hypothetical protein